MTKKTDLTVTQNADGSFTSTIDPTVTVSERSPARLALAERIAVREKAQEGISARQADARKLILVGEASKALAQQLASAKQGDAQVLAQHILSGATGGLPMLADEGRASLMAKIAEAEARADAAAPALAIIEGKITEAFAEFNRTASAVGLAVRPVVEEEIAILVEETKALMAQLAPLTGRLAGARAFAYSQGHRDAGDEKAAFLALGNSLDQVLKDLGINPHTAGHTNEGTWSAFSHRLTADADATVLA